jgi:hypothetical protein
LLTFLYHCFDRIVIHGYLSGLSRPEQVVHFVRHVLGIPGVSQETLSRRTDDRDWVEAYATTRSRWSGPRKASAKRITCYPQCAAWRNAGLTASFSDPNHRIPACQRRRFTHYYFYIRDEVLGRSSSAWPASFPFTPPTGSTATPSIERELQRAGVAFHKNDNAFLSVDDVAALPRHHLGE